MDWLIFRKLSCRNVDLVADGQIFVKNFLACVRAREGDGVLIYEEAVKHSKHIGFYFALSMI